jgi:hypothetical protein
MHTRRLSSFTAAAALLCLSAAAQPVPKAEEVLDKFVEATGGKAAYQKIHSESSTGTLEFVGKGIKGIATSYRAEPNRLLTVVELEGVGTVEEGTDGTVAWQRSAMQGPRVKQGDERAASLRLATFNMPLLWRKIYKQAENAGVEDVAGQPCYKIVLTPNEGKPETQYFDKKTNLLTKMAMTLSSPMGDLPVEVIFSDYKQQDGLLTPRKVRQSTMGQEITITLDSVKYNVEISKEKFDPPADVKALVTK